ncbi:MAG: hypothetical protein U1E61_00010 [Bradyrhizobium sp.]|mgnify:CR=1 FL=1
MRRTTRFPDDLSPEDRRTSRRWTRGLYLSYAAAVAIAIGMTFVNRPATDLRADSETRMARLKPASTYPADAASRLSTAAP